MQMIRKGWFIAGLGLALMVGVVGCQEDNAPASSVTTPEGAGGDLAQGGRMRMPLLNRLDRQLNLTPTQHDAIKAMLQHDRQEMRDSGVFAQGRDAVHAAMQARREKTAGEIAALLTPEQQTTFSEMRARMKERLSSGFGHGEVLTKELGLTPEQQEKVKAMMEARPTASRGVRAGLHSGNSNRTELRKRFRAEREAFHNELKAILTPDQQVLLQKRIDERKNDFQKKN